ncbi:MAG: hypothetical protein RIS90_3251, partial [Pseudomonadota bacterium]
VQGKVIGADDQRAFGAHWHSLGSHAACQ